MFRNKKIIVRVRQAVAVVVTGRIRRDYPDDPNTAEVRAVLAESNGEFHRLEKGDEFEADEETFRTYAGAGYLEKIPCFSPTRRTKKDPDDAN